MASIWQRGLLAWVIAAPVLTLTSGAYAQNQDAAVETMIRRGLDLRRQGHDDQAFQAFESAWSVSQSPRARAQMALAAQALGRWADADHFLRDALGASGDPWVSDRRAVLEQSLSQIDAHLGLLEVQCNIDGAVVRVDGSPRGSTPLVTPLRLPAGTVTLQIGAPGYLEVTRQAVLTIGETTREELRLVAVPSAPTPPEAPPVRASVTPVPRARPTPGGLSPRGSLQRGFAWTSGGVAVLGLATGAVLLGLRNSEAQSFNARNEDTDPANDCARASASQACMDSEATVRARGTVAAVGFVVGGAAALASALLFATLSPREAQARRVLGVCVLSPGAEGLGAACGFRF